MGDFILWLLLLSEHIIIILSIQMFIFYPYHLDLGYKSSRKRFIKIT